jgi:pyruvate dehydrogenase E2 component (dihydrolipoyllysine-residue acetyltransferase)
MATEVIMPALGVAQEKGTLLNWLKKEGQTVTKGEPLMEIETDKATVEIEAPASGILTHVTAHAGAEVPVGQAIAVILAPGEKLPEKARIVSAPRPAPAAAESLPKPKETPEIPPLVSGSRLLASPAAKRLAREKGIEISSLKGTGPQGSIIAQDILRAEEPKGEKTRGVRTDSQTVPLTPMRRIVGQRMRQSKQTAPHFYLSIDVDMTAVSDLRQMWKEGGKTSLPSINDFILQACARALKEFSMMNATFTEHGIQLHGEVNLGMAVALDEGLVVPVIRNADALSLEELAQQSRALADKAQNKKLFPQDYEDGTFTVSNLGMLGVDNFIAIINPPQSAILAIGKVAPRVVTDGDGMMIRTMMTMSLSADHRVVDGAIGARFLQRVKTLLEHPEF